MCEHFHLYVYGAHFTIVTEHKPLLGFSKTTRKHQHVSVDGNCACMLPYNFSLVYRPGRDAENPADYMSRHPCQTESLPHNIAEDYVNYISRNVIPKAMTIEEVKSATLQDPLMQILIQAIETNQWDNPELKPFRNDKDELSVANGLVLRQTRVVIPPSLQQKSVDLAHDTHQGIVKTKSFIREKIWFPAIDRIVEDKVENCFY